MVDFGQHYEIRVLDGARKLDSLRQQEDTGNQEEFDRNIAKAINKEALEVVVTIDSTQNEPPHDLDSIIPAKLTCFVDKHFIDVVSLETYIFSFITHLVLEVLFNVFHFRFKKVADRKKLFLSTIDPSDIANDLRINVVALRPFYEYLGCKLVCEKNIVLATLRVPLVFPSVRRRIR
ncbi:hypothetical protein H5410_004099, partial [Solanum commersonii]